MLTQGEGGGPKQEKPEKCAYVIYEWSSRDGNFDACTFMGSKGHSQTTLTKSFCPSFLIPPTLTFSTL